MLTLAGGEASIEPETIPLSADQAEKTEEGWGAKGGARVCIGLPYVSVIGEHIAFHQSSRPANVLS
jgi:hypothetical protein